MNGTATVSELAIEQYLTRLDASLRALRKADRDDFVREIRTHIADAVGPRPEPAAVERVLDALGLPEELGEHYRVECQRSRTATRSFSPWLLMSTAWRWATISIKGLAAFIIGMFGYTVGLVFYGTAMAKPFVPSIGMWVGVCGLQLGTPSQQQGMHEVAGPYYIPIAFGIGFLFFLGTTQLLRLLMRGKPSLKGAKH